MRPLRAVSARVTAVAVRRALLLALLGTLFVTMMGLRGSAGTGIPNSDDLVRLVEVRDLLAGQSWFDLTSTGSASTAAR